MFVGRLKQLAWFTGILMLLLAGPGWAVTIDSGDGTGNVSAPADDPGWANAGYRTGRTTSVTYLGDRWILTASHVGAGSVMLNGVSYDRAVPLRQYFLDQPDSTRPDLILFRIQDRPPGLPTLAIDATGVSGSGQGTELLMIGYGRDRQPTKTYWNSSWGTTTSPGVYAGYRHVATNTMRWGTNRVTSTGLEIDPTCGVTEPGNAYCKPTKVFSTVFNSGLPTDHEARANSGDSGGPIFRKRTGSWYLTGIMVAIDSYMGQPSHLYIPYGTSTFAADLNVYRDDILAVIAANPDSDDDGHLDADDNCPATGNADQLDSDGDGAGDACDVCPDDEFDDSDADGWCGDVDLCPDLYNDDNTDTNGDSIGDACQCGDVTQDGVINNDDVTQIWLAYLGTWGATLPGINWARCDVSDNGVCDLDDVTAVWFKYLGRPEGAFAPGIRWECGDDATVPPGAP